MWYINIYPKMLSQDWQSQPQCWLAQNNFKEGGAAKQVKKKKEHQTRRKKTGKEEQEKECREL